MTSPGLTSILSPPSSCTQPAPDMTIRTWPAGWVCHAERAPGAKVTRLPDEVVLSFGAYQGSTVTDPVNVSAAPLVEGREPLREISMRTVFSSPDVAACAVVARPASSGTA